MGEEYVNISSAQRSRKQIVRLYQRKLVSFFIVTEYKTVII